VGDLRLFFDVDGVGLFPAGTVMDQRPTLLLLHGGPGFDHSPSKPRFSQLADVCQVVYLDHRGQGRSDPSTPDRWTLNQWADDVRSFCDALEINRPIVLGQSFGGFVALNYALRHPDHPGKLILSSTTAKIRLDRALPMFERLGGPRAREVAERFWSNPTDEHRDAYMEVCLPLYTRTPLDPDALARVRMRPEVSTHFIRGEMLTYDFTDRLGQLACPTLVVAGGLDPITPVADAEDLAAALPVKTTRLEVFPNAGHGVFRDEPDEFLALVRDFITEDVSAATSTRK
jgi:pimeloyl-ACP methyl ester carboxylesterase